MSPLDLAAWHPSTRRRRRSSRFAQETTWDPGGDLPAARVATEWLVEARDDGTCLVRMVMRGFGTGAGWDDELEGMAAGMRAALHALASYRTHFPGRPAAWVRVSGAGTGAAAAAWDELTGALGLAGAGPGRRFTAGPGRPGWGPGSRRAPDGDDTCASATASPRAMVPAMRLVDAPAPARER